MSIVSRCIPPSSLLFFAVNKVAIGALLLLTFFSTASTSAASPSPVPQELSKDESKSSSDANASEPAEPRSIADIHRDLRRLEKGTAKAKDDAARAANIVALCKLFIEIGEHPETTKSYTLQNLSVRLRMRLKGLDRRTSDELKRRGIQPPKELIQEERDQRAARAQYGSLASAFVAQERQKKEAQSKGNNTSASRASSDQQSSSSGESSSIGQSKSGSTAGKNGAMRGNSAPGPDYGWQLVNLIRMTVRPDYWSIAGGSGKAIYFGQARALVIHGSWRVQEEVADLLTALRGG